MIASLDGSLEIPPERAQSLLLRAAQAGHADAQFWVASRFILSGGCDGSERADLWLREAAARGSAAAQVLVAEELLAQTNPDIVRVRSMLEQAAKSADYYAQKHAVALLAAARREDVREPAAALAASETMLKHRLGDDPQLAEAGAIALAASGDFQRAAALQKEALQLAHVLSWNTQKIQERLDAYASGRSWSGDIFAVPAAQGPLPRVARATRGCTAGRSRCQLPPPGTVTETGSLIPK